MSNHGIIFKTEHYQYRINTYPTSTSEPELWMRTVIRHQKNTLKMTVQRRQELFIHQFGDTPETMRYLGRKYKPERQISSWKRVQYKQKRIVIRTEMIPKIVANKRAIVRVRRAAQKMKTAHSDINRAISALMRWGLLKSSGKYDQFRRTHKFLSKGQRGTYGITTASYPSLHEVDDIAFAVYEHPELLTNSPDWVLRYRKGKSKIVGDTLVLPSQQITLSQIDPQRYTDVHHVTTTIKLALDAFGIDPTQIKVRSQGGPLYNTPLAIAAYVYFETAYHARSAIQILNPFGRVSLGQTVVTARVVASKVSISIKMLISESDGPLAEDLTPSQLHNVNNSRPIEVFLQEWIDKDGRVTFIKIKLVDLTGLIFKRLESRVSYLLEYVGAEGECRRFYPNLIDQFYICNNTVFTLPNGVKIKVIFTLTSGDHLATWAKTGRPGGNESRDLFSNHSRASMYHLVAYQDKPTFNYSRYMKSWKAVNEHMHAWKTEQIHSNILITAIAEREQLHHIYRIHGRVERIPALGYGDTCERPSVYNQLNVTPLVLHNQSYCNLITLQLCLDHIVKRHSKKLKQLQGRLKGLVDGLGTTKCATSGTGIRHLINDCLMLTPDTIVSFIKYSPLWYLMDTICFHLHLKTMTHDRQHCALMDHERLCFTVSTLLWWALLGDLSMVTGGRELKNGNKNHLEDKIYAYEMVNTCPEWEEHHRIPLSLVDESIFEASFASRDEMINAMHSKIRIVDERKCAMYKDMINTFAPVKRYGSIMAGLPPHIRQNFIIRSCWRSQLKWSFAIGTGLLPRISNYSYHARVTLSKAHDIHMDTQGPIDKFHLPRGGAVQPPTLIIDPCGECAQTIAPSIFPITLRNWCLRRRVKIACTRTLLFLSKAQRIRKNHLTRARKYHTALTAQLLLDTEDQDGPTIIKHYNAYNLYRTKYPSSTLPDFKATPAIQVYLQAQLARRVPQDVWDADMSSVPTDLNTIQTDGRTWTKKRLKEVIRYFKLHGNNNKDQVRMSGKREQLVHRVVQLLTQFRTIQHLTSAS